LLGLETIRFQTGLYGGAVMRKIVVLGTTAILLGGCALPVPFQIASWALDGISVLVTQKSVSDHGISMIAQKDCAVWRGVVEGELCRDEIESDVLVAEDVSKPVLTTSFVAGSTERPVGGMTPSVPSRPSGQQIIAEQRQAGVTFSHAMTRVELPEQPIGAPVHALRAQPVKKAPVSMPVSIQTPVQVKEQPVLKPVKLAKWSPPAQPEYLDREPTKGIYFVIGSFRNQGNALRLTSRHKDLSATMITAKLGSKKIYRVVVGPVRTGEEKVAHKVLRRAGLIDTWAMRVNPSDWSITERAPGLLPKSGGEVARLSQ